MLSNKEIHLYRHAPEAKTFHSHIWTTLNANKVLTINSTDLAGFETQQEM